jgi:N-acetylglucosamine-6-phosphate deacetylase
MKSKTAALPLILYPVHTDLCYLFSCRDIPFQGTVVMGIIDLHTHGLAGLDTQDADPAAMLAIAQAHGLAGAAGIVLSLHSAPVETMRARMAAVGAAMERQALPGAARILGVHLEGPFLNPAACGALDPASFIVPAEQAWRRLVKGYERTVRTVTVAPELPGAPGLIRRIAKEGIRVNMGHSMATYAEAESGFRAGASGITHIFNAMRPFHHREPGIAGFALLNGEVFVEFIGDLVHVHPKALELLFRMKEHGRLILVSDSVRVTVPGGEGAAPVKAGRLLGGSMTVADAVARLIAAGFGVQAVMRAATENPAAYLGL